MVGESVQTCESDYTFESDQTFDSDYARCELDADGLRKTGSGDQRMAGTRIVAVKLNV